MVVAGCFFAGKGFITEVHTLRYIMQCFVCMFLPSVVVYVYALQTWHLKLFTFSFFLSLYIDIYLSHGLFFLILYCFCFNLKNPDFWISNFLLTLLSGFFCFFCIKQVFLCSMQEEWRIDFIEICMRCLLDCVHCMYIHNIHCIHSSTTYHFCVHSGLKQGFQIQRKSCFPNNVIIIFFVEMFWSLLYLGCQYFFPFFWLLTSFLKTSRINFA